jgi:hypothetical protein
MRKLWLAGALAVGWFFAERRAYAQARYSAYERQTIEAMLHHDGARIDPKPEGKRIRRIDIVTLPVFEKRDPVPKFFNVFHVTSRKRVIRRELLFRAGQPYQQALVDESARNLRALPQLSLVLLVPLEDPRPNSVDVVVITKDVWSLRLNSNFGVAGGQLTFLVLQPSEINWFGTHTSVSALFILKPDTYSLGGEFTDPRVAGSRIEADLNGNVIVNRATGRAEGSFGDFYYGQPLYSLETKWAWDAQVAWRTEITRLYEGLTERTYDAPATPENDAIPYEYSTDVWYGAYEVTRSFGHGFKNDLTFGLEVYRQAYRARDLSGFDPRAAHEFVSTQVPVSDTRLSPYVQLDAHSAAFLRVLDFNTLGLQEDYKLGPEAILRLFPAAHALGSTRNLLGSFAAVSYTAPFGNGLARVLAQSTIQLSTPEKSDVLFGLGARVVTPELGFGRLVYDGSLEDHYKNYFNQRYELGGNTRLRGYPDNAFLGEDLVASTLEFRSRPVDILTAELGGALFYDAGDAFDGFRNMALKTDAGFGVRILFPQLDRIVFRADWGFPLTPGYNTFPGAIYFTFGQAFPMPEVAPPTVTAGILATPE